MSIPNNSPDITITAANSDLPQLEQARPPPPRQVTPGSFSSLLPQGHNSHNYQIARQTNANNVAVQNQTSTSGTIVNVLPISWRIAGVSNNFRNNVNNQNQNQNPPPMRNITKDEFLRILRQRHIPVKETSHNQSQTGQNGTGAGATSIVPKTTSNSATTTSVTTLTSTGPEKGPPKDPKRLRNYCVGPKLGGSPLKCMDQFICRKSQTDEYYVIKTLLLKDEFITESLDDTQGKQLFHTERQLLSTLKNVTGVVQEHGMFMDVAIDEFTNERGLKLKYETKRLCLVMDCFAGHDFHSKYSNLTNLQFYVIKRKKLPEPEALKIFWKTLQILERVHEKNIVHRDLKLANFVFDRVTGDITLSNFVLGKQLSGENELLADKRGSPAYVSPEIVVGRPYLGKPSDMWAMGVLFFTMLYGVFPFYDTTPQNLFRKIREAKLEIPDDSNVSEKSIDIVKKLLDVDPRKRLTASEAVTAVRDCMVIIRDHSPVDGSEHMVPDCHPGAERPKKRPRPVVETETNSVSDSEPYPKKQLTCSLTPEPVVTVPLDLFLQLVNNWNKN